MSNGLIPGATLPDFELPDTSGTLRTFSELQGDNPMILFVGRGERCPRERQH
jgi:peroxiredoxin